MSAAAPELRLIRAAFRSPLPTPPAVEYTGHRNAAPLPVRQCRGRSRPADVADSAPAATSGQCCRYILFTCIVYHIPPLFASGCRKVTYSFTAPAKNNCAFLYGRSPPPLPAFLLTTLFAFLPPVPLTDCSVQRGTLLLLPSLFADTNMHPDGCSTIQVHVLVPVFLPDRQAKNDLSCTGQGYDVIQCRRFRPSYTAVYASSLRSV